jgi:LytS/YehU family sensor histidine kinase
MTNIKFIDSYLEIIISNNYDSNPSQKRGTGTGILNVSRRLELFYGKKASIDTIKENGLYTVTIYIPVV